MAEPAWQPVRTADGSYTLRHAGHGEACHSLAGAWEESLARYAQACDLRGCAARAGRVSLLDVGTGAGLNLTAALHVLADTGTELDVLTLEADPSVIAAGGALPAPPGAEAEWEVAREVLDAARRAPGSEVPLRWGAGCRGRLRLRLGPAEALLPEEPEQATFDAVFLDGFSPARTPELWSARFLREVAARMRPGGWLSTFSAASEVRIALAAVGLGVWAGPRVGTKREGTLASPEAAGEPLPERITRRIQRRVGEARRALDEPAERKAGRLEQTQPARDK